MRAGCYTYCISSFILLLYFSRFSSCISLVFPLVFPATWCISLVFPFVKPLVFPLVFPATDEDLLYFLSSVAPFVFPALDFNDQMHYCAAAPVAPNPQSQNEIGCTQIKLPRAVDIKFLEQSFVSYWRVFQNSLRYLIYRACLKYQHIKVWGWAKHAHAANYWLNFKLNSEDVEFEILCNFDKMVPPDFPSGKLVAICWGELVYDFAKFGIINKILLSTFIVGGTDNTIDVCKRCLNKEYKSNNERCQSKIQ